MLCRSVDIVIILTIIFTIIPGHIRGALNSSQLSQCNPKQKTVKLILPGNHSYTHMTPQHLIVSLCGGGCHNPSHSCVSTSHSIRQVPVILSRCGVEAGVCRKECGEVEVVEDTSCVCSCLAQQAECGPLHSFNSETCQCNCRDQETFRNCREQGRVWDTVRCECRCHLRDIKPCSTEQPLEPLDNSIDALEKRDASSEAGNRNNNFELIIIVALCIVCCVFFLMILSLINNISNLRKTIRSLEVHNSVIRPLTWSGHYFTSDEITSLEQ